MLEGVDYFQFNTALRYTTFGGDQYELQGFIIPIKKPPQKEGWYPIINGVRSDVGRFLSYWDGISWSKPVACEIHVGHDFDVKSSNQMYWWIEPWWSKGPVAKG